jgi:AcrR family transcriptional regulator
MLARMARANPMTPDERRRALIDATRPLLLEYGTSITTRQIAECAGVAEGTIFRAFGTKQDLIDAVVEDCMAPEPVVAAIDAIPAEFDLEDTVTWVIKALSTRIQQIRLLMSALSEPHPHKNPRKPPHGGFHRPVDQAIARVLARFDDQLAVGIPTACWVVSAMAFAAEMPMMDRPDDGEPRNLARLILHGIAAPITLEASC